MPTTQAEIDALRADAAGAAALRQVFYAATARYKHPACSPMNDAARAVWAELYEAVRDSEAGLRLWNEVVRLRAAAAADGEEPPA